MKHLVSAFTFFLLFLVSFTNLSAENDGHHIVCELKGVEENTKIQLGYHQGKNKLLQDTARVKDGKVVFSDTAKLPRGLYLVIIPGKSYFDIVVSDDQEFTFKVNLDSEPVLNSIKFKGSEENEDYYDLLSSKGPLNKELSIKGDQYLADSCSKDTSSACKILKQEYLDLKEKVNEIELEYIEEHPAYLSSKMINLLHDSFTPEFKEIEDEDKRAAKRYYYYKKHFFDNVDFKEEGLVRTPLFEGKVDEYFDGNLIVKTCDSTIKEIDDVIAKVDDYQMFRYLTTHLYSKYSKSKLMCFDCINLHFYQNYFLKDERVDWYNEDQIKSIQKESWKLEHNQCGNKAFPLTLEDTTGTAYDLYKVDSKYTVLYFWSATCGHCKKATPKLQTLYEEIKDVYDMEVYSVCIDSEDLDPFKDFIKKYNFTWLNLLGSTAGSESYRTAYNVFSTPTIYIVDKEKKIIAKKLGVNDIKDFLQKYDNLEKNKSQE